MATAEEYVFVSHSSDDNPRVRPIVEALLAADLEVWVDRPADMGFTGNELRRLHAGESWHGQIIECVRQAACVLVCLSGQATEIRLLGKGAVWGQEIAVATLNNTLVPCMVEPFDFTLINTTFGLSQAIDLSPGLPAARREAHMRHLVEDVRLKIANTLGRATSVSELDARRMRNPRLLTYGAGRDPQQNKFIALLRDASEQAGIRPLVFAGPDNEQPGGFWDHLRWQAREVLGRDWQMVDVYWPYKSTPDEFAADYSAALAFKLGVRADPEAIAKRLAHRPQPSPIFHRIEAEEWGRRGGERLTVWLEFWRDIALRQPGVRVLPIIELVMPEAQPGWQEREIHFAYGSFCCPPDPLFDFRREVKNRQILSEVMALTGQPANGAPALNVLPVLPPVLNGAGDKWLRDLGERGVEVDYETARRAVQALYAAGRARTVGVNQKVFSDHLAPVLSNTP